MPALKCDKPECNFKICLNCAFEKRVMRDHKGHPLDKYDKRKDANLPCSYCGTTEKKIISCVACNVDICDSCVNKKKDLVHLL